MLNRMMLVGVLLLLVMTTGGAAAQDQEDDLPDLTPPELGDFDPATVAEIDPADYPVLPELTAHAQAIYARGLEMGNNPHVFTKVGDCMTAAPEFLSTCGPARDLGDYEENLADIIAYFAGEPARTGEQAWEQDSFATPSLASASGFNTTSALDPLWANPDWCEPNEAPLTCEYRLAQPAFAVILFGANDVQSLPVEYYDYYLRSIVLETIESGVVPVLNTFPGRPEYPEKSQTINQIVIQVAEDYDLPLLNLWLALQALPDGGIDMDETIHLTALPAEQAAPCDFTEETLQTGYTYRNLLTLQALDLLVEGLEAETEAEADGE